VELFQAATTTTVLLAAFFREFAMSKNIIRRGERTYRMISARILDLITNQLTNHNQNHNYASCMNWICAIPNAYHDTSRAVSMCNCEQSH